MNDCGRKGGPSAPRGLYATRRRMLLQAGAGFGMLAWLGLTATRAAGLASAPRGFGKAKRAIFLFMEGGPSHIDLFDPKPTLTRLHGQPLPGSFKPVITPMGEYNAPLMASKRRWSQHGECGTWVSDWLPHTATMVDQIAVVRSCWGNGLNHSNGVCQMNTGSILGGRPSLGSWISYGLGSENRDLPGFVVMEDGDGHVINGSRNWSAGFMPASYQGTAMLAGEVPIEHLQPPGAVTTEIQQRKLRQIYQWNRMHQLGRELDSELEARINSFELAYRMQSSAPEAIELNQETPATLADYGIGVKETDSFGRKCLLARRLVERGVRFVQLYHGAGSRWDAHSGIEKNHSQLCRASDLPVAGLLKDLKRRGLLEDTLVIWGGEFGRTPMSEKGDGRDHNPNGFTMWFAGGGVRGGQTLGTTDDLGLHAVDQRVHIHDLHATILHLMGVDARQLTYLHQGRPERPTQNEGRPFIPLFA